MNAVVYRCYGSPAVLRYQRVEKPTPADAEILVKVHAAAVNPLDWHYMRGTPYIMRLGAGLGAPTDSRFGVDFAGTVQAVGKSVTRFKPGDAVFGGGDGAFAEYLTITEQGAVALKPQNVTFAQAAALPVAAVTALQALRDKAHVRPGQRVLINGASGGVGTFAVQIAKSLGAEVTAVCSTRNVALVQSLGATHVIDYTKEDFTRGAQRYDVIVDAVGNHPLLDYRRVLTPKGAVIMVGGPNDGPWLGPLVRPLQAVVIAPFINQRMEPFLADLQQADLTVLGDLVRTGKLIPVVDRVYSLAQVPAAVRYLEAGHVRGKVVIAVDSLGY